MLDGPGAFALRAAWTEADLPAMIAEAAAERGTGAGLVQGVVHGLWGLVPGEDGTGLGIVPWLPDGWPAMALRHWRVGRTVLDLEVRRRPSGLLCRVVTTFGPALPVLLALRGPAAAGRTALVLDDVPLGQPVARFRAAGKHEALFV